MSRKPYFCLFLALNQLKCPKIRQNGLQIDTNHLLSQRPPPSPPKGESFIWYYYLNEYLQLCDRRAESPKVHSIGQRPRYRVVRIFALSGRVFKID